LSFLAIPFPQLDPIIVQLGPFAIRWYALAYIVGLLLGWRLVRRLVMRPGWTMTGEAVDDLLFYTTLGVILGGRIGYVIFYNLAHYVSHPLDILAVWHGGMSFHGGLIGVVIGAWWFSRKQRIPVLEVGDALAVATPIGLFLGRLANFVNGELWGRPTDVPWAMVFPTGGPIPRHPSQLYEAALEGVVLFVIMQIFGWRPRRPGCDGLLGGIFLTGYATFRFFVEFFREPDAQLGFIISWLTMGQILCIPMFLAGVFLIVRARRHMAGAADPHPTTA
jgi:phosphatidylglycerol:prolipoprotein diacylglycerol transferase